MKPDKKVCLYCGKQLDGRKVYCDDAHRMAYKRQPEQKPNPNTNKVEQIEPEQPESEQPEQSLRDSLTKTDKTFYDRAMRDFKEPYYNFNQVPERSEKCLQCSTTFKSRLRMLKYCSYEHYQEAISGKV